jgi:hypothetical protein
MRNPDKQSASSNVADPEIFSFLNSRADALAKLGVGKELREKCLIEICIRERAGDVAFARKHAKRIHGIALDPMPTHGTTAVFETKLKKRKFKSQQPSVFKPHPDEVLDSCIKSFPDELPTYEGYRRLRRAARRSGIPESTVTHSAVWRALKLAGFKVVGRQWQRL